MRKILVAAAVAMSLVTISAAAEVSEPFFKYDFENISDKTAVDCSKNNISATLSSGTMLTSGIDGNGIYLNGQNSSVTVSDTKLSQSMESFTFSFWVKPKSEAGSSGTGNILSCQDSLKLEFDNASRKLILKISSTAETTINPEYSFEKDKWYNIAITYSGDKVSLYANGKQIAQSAFTGSISDSPKTMVFGYNGESCFKGCIDEIIYFKECLAEDKLVQLYEAVTDNISEWNNVSYPLVSIYPNGISSAKSELFTNSKIARPIETGFEEKNEINAVESDNAGGQLSISEDCFEGKFALKATQLTDEYIPIKESEYFKIKNLYESESPIGSTGYKVIEKNDVFTVQSSGLNIKVYGNTSPNTEVTILLERTGNISYVDQIRSNSLGYYEFNFKIKEYGTYKLSVNSGKLLAKDIKISEKISEKNEVKNVYTKCNRISMKLKPMYASDTISFYTRILATDENGSEIEQYALIKSDKNGDGIFKVGEDLSRGKWQSIELDLTDVEEQLHDGTAQGIYMKANNGGEWLFDNISSEYRKTSVIEWDLSKFAVGNLILADEKLKFASQKDNENAYNISPVVATSGIDVSEKISDISVKSSVENGYISEYTETAGNVIFDEPFTSDKWIVNDENYDTAESGVSKKTQKYYRTDCPESTESNSYYAMVEMGEKEQFRIVFDITAYNVDVSIGGKSTRYQKGSYRTSWYNNNIRMSASSNHMINVEWHHVEYTKANDTEKDILIKPNGSAAISPEGIASDTRTKISFGAEFEQEYKVQDIALYIYDKNNNITYSSKQAMQSSFKNHQIDFIIPAFEEGSRFEIKNEAGNNEIRISDFKIYELTPYDYDANYRNPNKLISYKWYGVEQFNGTEGIEHKEISLVLDGNDYAVIHQNAIGMENIGNTAKSISVGGVYRIVNLSRSPRYVICNYTKYWLQYGENDLELPQEGITLPVYQDENNSGEYLESDVYVLSYWRYEDDTSTNNVSLKYIDGMKRMCLSGDGAVIYYNNLYDNEKIYSYNLLTNEYKKVSDEDISLVTISPDGSRMIVKDSDNRLYYYVDGKLKEIMNYTGTTGYKWGTNNEFIVVDNEYYYYRNGEMQSITSDSGYYDLNKVGDCIAICSGTQKETGVKLYKYSDDGVWYMSDSFTAGNSDFAADSIKNVCLSNDNSVVYAGYESSGYSKSLAICKIDVATHQSTVILSGYKLIDVCDNGKLLMYKDDNYYLYDPVTENTQKVFTGTAPLYDYISYNSETKTFTVMNGEKAGLYVMGAEAGTEKYMLSFDGKNNWYSFRNGRWILGSEQYTPTADEMRENGMTAEEINEIQPSAINKLYAGGDDILTLDIALYMNSNSTVYTPVIEEIKVNTISDENLNGLFGVNIKRFDKSDYRTVSSVFPIESFTNSAECYYLLYIGSDWLYTYKNGRLSKVVESADELLSDMEKTWINFKQYGMSAKELRNIPQEEINSLFVNSDYANSEFGIIYVVKTDKEDTSEFTVDFKIQSEANYLDNDDVVVEVVMNGNEVKVIDSQVYSADEVENFLNWIEARQNGSGEIFYRLKGGKNQYFINYYMINSINVYDGAEYRAEAQSVSEETETEN